ncbi:hypothetical protein Ancab_004107 [Ancistrocladus abbreviatus]
MAGEQPVFRQEGLSAAMWLHLNYGSTTQQMHYKNACYLDDQAVQQIRWLIGADTDLLNNTAGDEDKACWCAARACREAMRQWKAAVFVTQLGIFMDCG